MDASSYFAANAVSNIIKGPFVGVEYLKRSEDESGDDGTANGLQFSVCYSFNI